MRQVLHVDKVYGPLPVGSGEIPVGRTARRFRVRPVNQLNSVHSVMSETLKAKSPFTMSCS
jgi:hypothetical protein